MQLREFKLGSLQNRKDRKLAARLLAQGEIVGIFNRGVCALWFDGANEKAVKRMWQIKGEGRVGRPIALTLGLEEFISMIDIDILPSDVRNLINAPDFKSQVGSLCFIRAPVKTHHQKSIPKHAKSFESGGICMIQNWDPFGHDPTEEFLKKVKRLGVKHPAVTSMNITGQKEIVDQKKGEAFCKKYGIPIFLKDPNAHPQHIGSYTIFTFGKNGIRLERDGNIPAKLFKKIFGIPFDTKGAKKPNYPQIIFPGNLLGGRTGKDVRTAVLLYLQKGS